MLRPRRILPALLLRGAAAVPALLALTTIPAVPPAPIREGDVVYVWRPTTVRTRGNGNLTVDLPRGRALLVERLEGETAILSPSLPDADLLRQFGVRRIPRYKVPRPQLLSDFLPVPAWEKARVDELARLHERWPALPPDRLERVLQGDPWVGMGIDQAEEAVGAFVFSREARNGLEGKDETWRIGRRPRAAELRQFTEGRERGVRARTFEEYLVLKSRALLRFRDGILVEIAAPDAERPEGAPGERERSSGGWPRRGPEPILSRAMRGGRDG